LTAARLSAATPSSRLDLPAYLRRIGYAGSLDPTRATLDALHAAHATSIPFENLDILLGRRIAIDLDSVQAKLVAARRGGYCFEQNALFAAALEHLGFAVTRLAARVRFRTDRVLARTHMTLRVEVGGVPLLADVGFGGEGPLLPVPFDGTEAGQYAWTYRILGHAGEHRLQSRRGGGGWEDLYVFTPEPQLPVDYEMANHYTSTHPASRFVLMLTAQRVATDGRRILRNRTLCLDRGDDVTTRTLADDDELLGVLADEFGLVFPAGTRFAYQRDEG
jgi:N-hydroxyarylamine O-acetyltransferase